MNLDSNRKEDDDLPISKHDVAFLQSLGDTNAGYVARGEIAEMYDISAEIVDAVVLGQIYGKNWFVHRKYQLYSCHKFEDSKSKKGSVQ